MDKNKVKQIRQGDVLLIKTNEKTSGVETKNLTLALGEASGHHHTLYAEEGSVTAFSATEKGMPDFLDVVKDVPLKHQEHGPVTVPPGKYLVADQVEYTPQMSHRVAD